MAQEKKNFALREDGDDTSVFTGKYPRQAALKAARNLEPAESEDAAEKTVLRLREKGSRNDDGEWKVHEFVGWAWREESPDDGPDWMPDVITEANVSKEGTERISEI